MQGFQSASASVEPSRYPDIDSLLGNKKERYFGQGFRQVDYRLINQSFNALSRQLTADVRIGYPAHWSRKGQYPMKPHLSTIDAMWLNCCACDHLLSACYKITPGGMAPLIRRVEMKAGSRPLENLNAIPMSVKLHKTERWGEFRRFQSQVHAQIGGMTLTSLIEHDGQWRDAPLPAELDFRADPDRPNFFQCLRTTRPDYRHDLSRLEFDVDRVQARFSSDLGEADFLSPIEVILGLGQLAQALIYRKDGLSRRTSGTLWMRSIALENASHFRALGESLAQVRLDWHRTLRKGDESWRVFRLQGSLGSSRGLFSLAYRLPGADGETA